MKNTFRNAAFSTATALPRGEARTENGMRALQSTLNANVDLFGSIGAMRGKNVIPAFEKALAENQDVALRIAQWVRDVREGSGEREIFRSILRYLEANQPRLLLDSRLLENVAEIGRFDDLLIFTRRDVKNKAFSIIQRALREGNGLAAKWMPRKGPIAVELRNFMGMTPKQYRKMLVRATNVVETQMCQREFDSINFSHVPSVAMTRYMTAFHRRAPEAFAAYKAALQKGDPKVAKVNAGAVYPHDIVMKLGGATDGPMEGYSENSYYGRLYGGNRRTYSEDIVVQRMWEALPDYMDETAVLPIVDVSGSMTSPVAGSKTRALDVAVSLGLYAAERSKNAAFRNMLMTFSSTPKLMQVSGTLANRLGQMSGMSWGNTTDLHKALELVLTTGLRNGVPEAEMPKMLLIMSDMQFNQCTNFDDSAMQMIRRKYERAGYELPRIVFWNLRDGGNKPVRFNERGVALVSGFSPAIMQSVLAADLEKFTPESVMLKTLNKPRYNW